jgi:hypothetical protein
MFRAAAFAFALVLAPAVFASQEMAVSVGEGDFARQRAEIEKDLNDGKTYSEISAADRATVKEALDKLSGWLDGVQSVDALNESTRVAVFNAQEEINTILTEARADSRLVCERSKPTGSNRYVNTCQTVAERERRREDDKQRLRSVRTGIGAPNG